MKLSVAERLTLLMALPQEGDLTTIRIVARLRDELSFTEEEHAALGIEVADTGVRWNPDVDPGREYEFGAKATEAIVKALTRLSETGKLTAQHLTVCDKFGLE